MERKGQKFDKYEVEFKEKVVKEKLEQVKPFSFSARKYDVPKGTIETWVYQFRHKGSLKKVPKGRPKQDENIDYKEKYEIIKKYLEFLEEVEQEKK